MTAGPRVLWIASGNAKKRRELERLLEPLGWQIRTLADLPEPIDIVEDGDTFAANAAIKAQTLARLVGAPALGDDSGLCVDALDGRPGIFSARYAGDDASDSDRIRKLLGELDDRPDRGRDAQFVCHVCIADANGEVATRVEERCHGTIRRSPSGTDGFGYDPVFEPTTQPTEITRTFAEFSAEEKDEVSHRGKALRGLAERLSVLNLE